MTARILGVGLGLFLLVLLWLVTVVCSFISLRSNKKLGWLFIAASFIITVLLVIIPREVEFPPPVAFKIYDSIFAWRTSLVILLALSAVVGFVVVLITHFMEPKQATPLKYWKLFSSTLVAQMLLPCFKRSTIYQQTVTSLRWISGSQIANKAIHIKNDDEFLAKVIQSKIPVVVNFHANWCDPCHIMSSRLSELLDPLENIGLVTIDVDEHIDLLRTFEVKGVPAILAFRDGHVVDKFIGLVDADTIDKFIGKLTEKAEDTGSEHAGT